MPFRIGNLKCGNLSLGDIAGHGSFLFLAFSYLENDFLSLRLFAFSAITLSIIFQYYRPIPLWIPIRWNVVFLAINGFMIVKLLKDENDARYIPEEKKALYEALFEDKGMTPVGYLHLISIAKRVEAKKGDKIVTEGQNNNRVCLVKKGSLLLSKGGEQSGVITKYQFVGSMSYLNWEGKQEIRKKELKDQHDTFWHWNSDLQNVPLLFLFLNKSIQKSHQKPWDVTIDTVFSFYMDDVVGQPPTLSSDHSELDLKNTNELGNNQLELSENDSHLHTVGQAGVTCLEDCVLYSWSFKDLHELLVHDVQLGMVFEKCLSYDLNRKMANNWEEEHRQRYKMILLGATLGNEINAEKKELLRKWRVEHKISDQMHETAIADIHWTMDEFNRGHKGSVKPSLPITNQSENEKVDQELISNNGSLYSMIAYRWIDRRKK